MSTHKIAIVAMQGVQLLDVIGPSDVFAEANRQSGLGYYSVEVVSTSGSPVRGSSGLALIPDRLIDEEPSEVDTLLVAGDPLIQERPLTENLLRWVKQTSAKANRVGSVCSGAFVLGEAGLLTGKRATTHWSQASEFARRFPDVKLEPNRIFTKDGNVWTSAGVTAGIDLALAIVEQDLGLEIALRVARELVVFLKRPGGQTQFSTLLAGQMAQKTPIRAAQDFVADNLAADLTVAALAKRVGMSERNFSRQFKQEVGMTPADYVESMRLEAGRRLSEDTSIPLKRIAIDIGFSDDVPFRRSFARRFGTSPAAYRRSFGS
ncbi:transcriptional regulator GlxA family with amidase domain [Sinorhizobium meliloti]|uniref:GlxA family transcriptional regulator n=1 Tax=Rhizobium meliloti TaxID=382 RepID=UPI0002D26752|nr:GlxA family transcriptional regulator [Sinorhizobium meliloti]MBP2470397.1 transcriptional regulator GlxA family with amidase domain [Sinorhizobium meliloti]MDE4551570.1 GlxA family transcriptional regulator [Sinorhizobium meliloti]MQW82939.1 helix-turn-helix domain-containing protein [Sinorhizobium meliloti]RVO81542.1 GlxA family transcriptional regulator [Sinorhizobium meliloti]GEC37954.1 AraC family transcriptional regulator [Sinorhizobium meliloti]